MLRPSDRDPASVVTALLKRLTDALRLRWHLVRIVVRGDSGVCRPRVLRCLYRWGRDYVLGLQKNARLLQHSALALLSLADRYEARGIKQRLFGDLLQIAERPLCASIRRVRALGFGPMRSTFASAGASAGLIDPTSAVSGVLTDNGGNGAAGPDLGFSASLGGCAPVIPPQRPPDPTTTIGRCFAKDRG